MLDLLQISPLYFLVALFSIVVALTVHEYSHALGAKLMGDNTSEYMGRLTLNPLAHIDWIGFLLLIVAGFGWGKPVPFNPYNLRNNRWGQALIAAFGPASNFLVAALAIIALRALGLAPHNLLAIFLGQLAFISVVLGVFNLIPIPPLDGSKVLFSLVREKSGNIVGFLEEQGARILLLLIIADMFLGLGVFGWIGRLASAAVNIS